MTSNFNNTCRACIIEDEHLINISSVDDDFIEYSIKLYFSVPTINIDSKKYPQNICKRCIEDLRVAYKFKQKCLNSMYILSEILKKEDGKKEEEITIKQEIIEEISEPSEVNEHAEEVEIKESQTEVPEDPEEKPEEKVEDPEQQEEEIDDDIDDIMIERFENAIEEEYDEDHCYSAKIPEETPPQIDKESIKQEVETETEAETVKDNPEAELRDSVLNPIFPMVSESTELDTSSSEDEEVPKRTEEEPKSVEEVAQTNLQPSRFQPTRPRKRKRQADLPFSCTICDLDFDLGNLLTHTELHDHLEELNCPFCFRIFKNPSESQQFFRHYCPQYDKPAILLTCTVCYRKFRNSQALSNHRKTHDIDESEYKCQICDLYFVSLRKLDWHHRNGVHTDKKTKKLKHV